MLESVRGAFAACRTGLLPVRDNGITHNGKPGQAGRALLLGFVRLVLPTYRS